MNPCLDEIVNSDNIPSPPSVAVKLLDLVAKPDVAIDELVLVLSADPRLSSRLVGYCNSPMFGMKRTVTSLPQAVMVLGMRTLRLLSLSFSLMDTEDASEFDYDGFWRSSLATAVSAKCIAKRTGECGDEKFLLGLLGNIGLLGMGSTHPQKLGQLFATCSHPTELTTDSEQEVFGTNRYLVGGALLTKWNFPQSMVDAIQNMDSENPDDDSQRLILSQRMGALLLSDDADEAQIKDVRKLAEEISSIDATEFGDLFDEIVEDWNGYSQIFNYESISYTSMADLEARAKESMIQISLGMESELEQMASKNRELEEYALIDRLTSLKNRAAYDAEIEGAFDYHQRRRQSFGVVVIDVDHFKSFNDQHGHAAGDAVLSEVGTCLASSCRQYDTVYRYGGEEFVAIIYDCNRKAIQIVAERFRRSIEDLRVDFDDQTLRVTASVGVQWNENAQVRSASDLFKLADAKLYRAKAAGRNCVVIDESDNHACAT